VSALTLRPYQREAIDDLFARWRAGATRVPLVLATGLGKTVIFTVIIEEWLSYPANAGKRVLVIAHTNELIDQAARKVREVSPSRRVGIVKGALNSVMAEVIVSSRQTLASEKRRNQIKRIGLIVIDECHHAHSKNTYGRILSTSVHTTPVTTPIRSRPPRVTDVSDQETSCLRASRWPASRPHSCAQTR
jgi:superfamily II DNA or RNA helicase